MAWVKVPPEHHPLFLAAVPKDPRVETIKMFGGVAARVSGVLFAGLFGRSTMVYLEEPARAEALALPGASLFDPMGDGRVRSDKVILPVTIMRDPAALRRWIARAFAAAASKKVPKKGAPNKGPPKKGPPNTGAPKKGAPKKKAPKKKPKTIDEYLTTVSPDQRAALEKLRKTIRAILPGAEECISYAIPAFRYGGHVVAGFLATTMGCSYFPFSGTTLGTLSAELASYDRTKSALHFDANRPLSAALVRKLLRARVAETK